MDQSTSSCRLRDGGLNICVRPLRWLLSFLILASLVLAESKNAADYYVRSLPGQPDGPLLKMHAGHIEVDAENNGNLFFWHYQNRHIANRQRTVIWLNGGPGCSSMDGALMEIGPYRVNPNSTLRYNEGSWDEFAHLLFVDNPVGTGFSYVNTNSLLHELDEMADQFVIFLEKFFEIFPAYERDDLYIAGESYAGQHIPYIAKAIMNRNKKLPQDAKENAWNLKGLLIGNGWISPVEQYHSYLTFAYDEGLITSGSDSAKKVEAQHKTCFSVLDAPGGMDKVSISQCEAIMQAVIDENTKEKKECPNIYDIRLTSAPSASCGMDWPPDLTSVTPYLRQRNVTEALHIRPGKLEGWQECNGAVSRTFRPKKSKPSITLLPEILEGGIPILLYSGAKDYICNHAGTEDFIANMRWSGGTGFELSPGVWAPRHDWTFEGESAGIYQEARNLTYVLFYNSSHMVPFDYPRRSRDMLDQFMGVNITNIGGHPADSRIDGAKTNPTTVGGHPNSTAAEKQEQEKLKEATWKGYYKAGEAALVVVVIAAAVWGFFIWRGRRNRRGSGYRGIYPNGDGLSSASIIGRFRNKSDGDVEAADFDEGELDNLRPHAGSSSSSLGRGEDEDRDRYSIGEDSNDEEGPQTPREPKSILKNRPEDTEH